MTGPAPGDPAALTALTDPENMGWVEQSEELTEDQAYWRARGMVPPAEVELVE